jgi:hypothetical protein
MIRPIRLNRLIAPIHRMDHRLRITDAGRAFLPTAHPGLVRKKKTALPGG